MSETETAESSDKSLTREERMAQRHWMVVELFRDARDAGLSTPNWQPFSQLVEEKTGKRIPPGTLKYWYGGWSTPKVDEVEAMALALGWELDLLHPQS